MFFICLKVDRRMREGNVRMMWLVEICLNI